jgi:hypothetical protein
MTSRRHRRAKTDRIDGEAWVLAAYKFEPRYEKRVTGRTDRDDAAAFARKVDRETVLIAETSASVML